ncbi:MAG: c-type cytochrome [Pseudomonadota bacterium]
MTALALGVAVAAAPSAALAGDAKAGQSVYKAKCAMCHGDTAKSPAGLGPRLFGVMGRKAGSLPAYNYSPAMKASGLTWNPETMKRYLAAPQSVVRGNKMPMAPMASAPDRDNVTAYLATLR